MFEPTSNVPGDKYIGLLSLVNLTALINYENELYRNLRITTTETVAPTARN